MGRMLLTLLILSLAVSSAQAAPPFQVVFVDAKTEKSRLGAFPYDRAVYASAVKKLEVYGARGVILKLFIDLPKSEKGDARLAAAMEFPVLLQMSVRTAEKKPNKLPKRFHFTALKGKVRSGIRGKSGWIPHPRFIHRAADVGFVDVRSTDSVEFVPMIGRLKRHAVKSLWLATLERLMGETATVKPGVYMEIDDRRVALNEHNEVKIDWKRAPTVEPVSLIDLLDGKVDGERFEGKWVVLGYTGERASVLQAPDGPVSAHEAFIRMLWGLYLKVRSTPRL